MKSARMRIKIMIYAVIMFIQKFLLHDFKTKGINCLDKLADILILSSDKRKKHYKLVNVGRFISFKN